MSEIKVSAEPACSEGAKEGTTLGLFPSFW